MLALAVMSVVRSPCTTTLYDAKAADGAPAGEDPTDEAVAGSDRSRATAVTARSSGDAHEDVAGASGCARSGVEIAVVPLVFTAAAFVCGWLRATTDVERDAVDADVVDVIGAVAFAAVASLRDATATARSLCDAVDVAGASGCARSGVEIAVAPCAFVAAAAFVCGWLRATTDVERDAVDADVADVIDAVAFAAVVSLRDATATARSLCDAVDVAGASGCARSGVETAVVPRAFTAAVVVCG